MTGIQTDAEFEFELIFALPGTDLEEDVLADALFEAGCDDALVGLGTPGTIGLGFRRRASMLTL